jgi:hypothetical protein
VSYATEPGLERGEWVAISPRTEVLRDENEDTRTAQDRVLSAKVIATIDVGILPFREEDTVFTPRGCTVCTFPS